MRPMTFGRSFLPDLREILLSVDKVTCFGSDGEPTEVRDEPFLEDWQLRSLADDPKRGGSRVICVLAAPSGRNVTATIDASDFPGLRGNSSRSKGLNGSDRYHDLAVYVSVLLQEQIISRSPDTVPDLVRIQSPTGGSHRDIPDADSGALDPNWWAMRGE